MSLRWTVRILRLDLSVFTRLFHLALLICAVVSISHAQLELQAPFGPEGVIIRALAYDTSSGTIYAGGDGLYTSKNGGATWGKIASVSVECIALKNDGTIYTSGDGSALRRSTDGGVTWTQSVVSGRSTRCFFIKMDKVGNLYVGNNWGLYRSTNDGASFTIAKDVIEQNEVYDLSVDDDGCLRLATLAGIFRSTNNGQTWNVIGTYGTRFCLAQALVRTSRGAYFAGCYDGIYRSNDTCSTWSKVYSVDFAKKFTIINDSVLYCSTNASGIIRSTDYGEHWEAVNTGLHNLSIGSVLAMADGSVFAASGIGVYRAERQTLQWEPRVAGLGIARLFDFAVDSNGTMYASSLGAIMRSSDQGATWKRSQVGGGAERISWLQVSATGVIFAGTDEEWFRSLDGGDHWTHLTGGLPSDISTGFAILPSGTVLASFRLKGTFRSVDNGTTWNKVSGAASDRIVYYSADSKVKIFALCDNGVEYSEDDGMTWIYRDWDFYRMSDIAINRLGHLFRTDDYNGIFRSVDEGKSWQNVFVPPLGTYSDYTAVNADGSVYAIGSNGILFESKNNGNTWHAAYQGKLDVRKMWVDGRGFLNIMTWGAGIYRSKTSTSPAPVPNLFVASPLNLGRKRITQQHEMPLLIYNVGSSPLNIKSIQSSKTIHSSQTGAVSLMPYSVFADTLHYVLPDLGAYNEALLIESNSASSVDTVAVNVTGYGIPRLVYGDDSIQCGQVEVGLVKDTSTVVRNTGDDTLKISAIPFYGTAFKNTSLCGPPLVVPPGKSTTLGIRFAPTIMGSLSALVVAISNSEKRYDTLHLAGIGFAYPAMTLSIKKINFGTVVLKSAKDVICTVGNSGGDTLKINWISTTDSAFTISPDTLSLLSNRFGRLTVRYSPTRTGPDSAVILIFSNSKRKIDTLFVSGVGELPSAVAGGGEERVWTHRLYQNYPNPFNPTTVIAFEHPKEEFVSIEIFNVAGQKVAVLLSEVVGAGSHSVTWNAAGMTGGVYFCRYRSGAYATTQKIILLR